MNRPILNTPLLSEKDLAIRWNVSYRTLQDWRKTIGLPHIKLGKCIRYALDKIKAYEARHSHTPAGCCFMFSEKATDLEVGNE